VLFAKPNLDDEAIKDSVRIRLSQISKKNSRKPWRQIAAYLAAVWPERPVDLQGGEADLLI